MQCPKEKNVTLVEGTLSKNLSIKCCPDCQGAWIPAAAYEGWRRNQLQLSAEPERLTRTVNATLVRSPFDSKAALCPECQHYLSRAKVYFKPVFYVERCTYCGGIWCDKGEWDVLEKLGVHVAIEQMFSPEWQARVRELEQMEKERQATLDKLGPELAAQVFQLADLLEKHPYGDFGVAYLMRRVAGNENASRPSSTGR